MIFDLSAAIQHIVDQSYVDVRKRLIKMVYYAAEALQRAVRYTICGAAINVLNRFLGARDAVHRGLHIVWDTQIVTSWSSRDLCLRILHTVTPHAVVHVLYLVAMVFPIVVHLGAGPLLHLVKQNVVALLAGYS